MKPAAKAIPLLLAVFLLTACGSEGVVVTNEPQSWESISPADWKQHSSSSYHLSFKCPKTWVQTSGYTERYQGEDGFVSFDAQSGAGMSLDQVAELNANHKLKPYGSHPDISSLELAGQEARLITPSSDQPHEQNHGALLVLRTPFPLWIGDETYHYLLVYADVNHVRQIAETIVFQARPTLYVSSSVTLTERPGEGRKLRTLETGRTVSLLDTKGDWVRVGIYTYDTPVDTTGWAPRSRFVAEPKGLTLIEGRVNGATAIMNAPSAESRQISQVNGAPILISRREPDWLYGHFPGGVEGWIPADRVEYVGPAAAYLVEAQ